MLDVRLTCMPDMGFADDVLTWLMPALPSADPAVLLPPIAAPD